MFAIMFETTMGKFLGCNKDGSINVSDHQADMVRQYEDMYAECYSGNNEAKGSAIMHSLVFNLSVVPLPDTVEELLPMLESKRFWSLKSLAGSGTGVKIKQEFWDVFLKNSVKIRVNLAHSFNG